MSKLIDLDAAINALGTIDCSDGVGISALKCDAVDDVITVIKELPTVDAVPVRHGRWIDCDTQCGILCSVCGTPVDDFCHSIDYIDLEYKPNYCPNCGARMDGKGNGNETD